MYTNQLDYLGEIYKFLKRQDAKTYSRKIDNLTSSITNEGIEPVIRLPTKKSPHLQVASPFNSTKH